MSTFSAASSSTSVRASSTVLGARTGPATKRRGRLGRHGDERGDEDGGRKREGVKQFHGQQYSANADAADGSGDPGGGRRISGPLFDPAAAALADADLRRVDLRGRPDHYGADH